MTYKQLTLEETTMIYSFCKAKYSISQITKEIVRHKSTNSREINRNTGRLGYRPKHADEKAMITLVERKHGFAIIVKQFLLNTYPFHRMKFSHYVFQFQSVFMLIPCSVEIEASIPCEYHIISY